MNQVWLSGKAVDDVWIRKNDNNQLVASFSIDTSDGAIRCIAFRNLADKAGMLVRKGRLIEVSGSLAVYRSRDRYVFNVQVESIDTLEDSNDKRG